MYVSWSLNQDLQRGVPVRLVVPNLEEIIWDDCWGDVGAIQLLRLCLQKPRNTNYCKTLCRGQWGEWWKVVVIPMSLSPTKIHQAKAAQTMQLALFSTWTNTNSVEYCHVVLWFLGRFWLVTSKNTAGLCGKHESLHCILWSLAVSRRGGWDRPLSCYFSMIANKNWVTSY